MLANAPAPKPDEERSARITFDPQQWERLPVTDDLIGRVVQFSMSHEFLGHYATLRGELRGVQRHPGGNVTLKIQTTAACFPDLSPGESLPANLPWPEVEETCCLGFARGIEVLKSGALEAACMPKIPNGAA